MTAKADPVLITAVAERFVSLVEKYPDWLKVLDLPLEEIQVFYDILVAAGFEFKEIAPGKLINRYSRDGEDESNAINKVCAFHIVKEKRRGNSEDHDILTTGWLDCAVRRVINEQKTGAENHAQSVEAIRLEILRSIPLEPIQLTRQGDFLKESLSGKCADSRYSYFLYHCRDNDDMHYSPGPGSHKYCGGALDIRRATEKHDSISCRACNMRVLFPKEVKTFGDLRRVMAEELKSPF